MPENQPERLKYDPDEMADFIDEVREDLYILNRYLHVVIEESQIGLNSDFAIFRNGLLRLYGRLNQACRDLLEPPDPGENKATEKEPPPALCPGANEDETVH